MKSGSTTSAKAKRESVERKSAASQKGSQSRTEAPLRLKASGPLLFLGLSSASKAAKIDGLPRLSSPGARPLPRTRRLSGPRLAWTEAVTQLHDQSVANSVYQDMREHFTEAEVAKATLAIVEINCWNRLNIAFRRPAGTYKTRVQLGET